MFYHRNFSRLTTNFTKKAVVGNVKGDKIIWYCGNYFQSFNENAQKCSCILKVTAEKNQKCLLVLSSIMQISSAVGQTVLEAEIVK